MSLQNFITERLKITTNSKSANILNPKTRDELISLIGEELERQGPDADLNHIDVSEITDMMGLFKNVYIENIKIDQWDTSNVADMSYMFMYCNNFNGDLSAWDTSKVKNMCAMFDDCLN